ncbi:MAG: DUF5723 family protein [Marinifilaceae bacterium]
MKKLLLLLTLFISSISYAQQALNTYFMYNNYLRTELNPALTSRNGFVAIPGLGGISLSTSSNAFTIDNILYANPNGNGLVTFLDADIDASKLLNSLKADNRLSVNANVNILSTGFYTKSNFWTISLKTKARVHTSLPRDLFTFAKIGPGADGEIYEMEDIELRGSSYAELGVGSSFVVNERLRLGFRGKFLAGLAGYNIAYNKLHAEFNANKWQIKSEGKMQVVANSVESTPSYDDNYEPYISYGDFNISPRGPAGYGFSIDAGAHYKVTNALSASVAVINFGKLWWQASNTVTADALSDYVYDGVFEIINDEVVQKEQASHNFEQLIRFVERDEREGFVETLPPTINIAAEYNFMRGKIGIGLLSSSTIGKSYTETQLMAAATFRPTYWFSGALSYAFINNQFDSFGFSINFHPSWINFYLGTDYFGTSITPQFAPVGSRNAGMYVGIGIPLNSARVRKYRYFEQ